jgi:hypothetical protein
MVDTIMGGNKQVYFSYDWHKGIQTDEKVNKSSNKMTNATNAPLCHFLSNPNISNCDAIADMDCSGQYIGENIAMNEIKVVNNGTMVRLPNGEMMQSTHIAYLPIDNLPKEAREAHIFPCMNNNALILIG